MRYIFHAWIHTYTHIIIEAFIAFTTHQALSSKGHISKYSTRDTIRSLMGSFFRIWQCEALKPVFFEYTQQVYIFIDSEQLTEIILLCTNLMPKHSMSTTDFEVLAQALFRDTGFWTLCMVLQVAYLINIQLLMTEHPRALIEGSKYNGTNEALTWGEHDFHIIPNKDNPHHPLIIIVIIKIPARKGTGGKSLYTKSLSSIPSPMQTTQCAL
ncbi:uncharacterized protein ARMOST_22198 [Armillaria ostoyae]|uniref:Uncharacterized protein n=1 Tax=Armillaria ostoyae TaxID=47428 RepID=A0A284SC70_ARMOS|nr:uncharacterized protein ARMOST_22198 [Armillaria ostoyae]